MQAEAEEEVLARVAASPPRRFLALCMLVALAFLVLYIAATTPPALGWQLFLIAVGTGALVMAQAIRKATRPTLELTRTVLRDDEGRVLARMEDVVSVDRGAFAFKPSNGFLLRLSKSQERAWQPGLWWRASRRIGVGGMTPMPQTKYMAELIAVMLEERKSG